MIANGSARSRRYAQVDVFTTRAGYGNPVAVVFDADDLDDAAMQRFAAWTNLSETTFVLTPRQAAADFRLRIFTPRQELPFAGHPTVGTTHAVLEAYDTLAGCERLQLECAAGLLPARVERSGPRPLIFVQAPAAQLAAIADALGGALAGALGVAAEAVAMTRSVDIGPRWLLAELVDAHAVRRLQPDLGAIAALTTRHRSVGVAAFGPEPSGDAAIAVRVFCPADGINEDPVTGSANAAIGALLHASGALDAIGHRYRASQGREVGRDGIVEIVVDPGNGVVEIGGACVTCIRGLLEFEAHS
ncbi:MAG: PhzF family phenazine biosynthesis protein [Dokdonella sp.]